MDSTDIFLAIFMGLIAGLLTWHLTNPHYEIAYVLGFQAGLITLSFFLSIFQVHGQLSDILAVLKEKS